MSVRWTLCVSRMGAGKEAEVGWRDGGRQGFKMEGSGCDVSAVYVWCKCGSACVIVMKYTYVKKCVCDGGSECIQCTRCMMIIM